MLRSQKKGDYFKRLLGKNCWKWMRVVTGSRREFSSKRLNYSDDYKQVSYAYNSCSHQSHLVIKKRTSSPFPSTFKPSLTDQQTFDNPSLRVQDTLKMSTLYPIRYDYVVGYNLLQSANKTQRFIPTGQLGQERIQLNESTMSDVLNSAFMHSYTVVFTAPFFCEKGRRISIAGEFPC